MNVKVQSSTLLAISNWFTLTHSLPVSGHNFSRMTKIYSIRILECVFSQNIDDDDDDDAVLFQIRHFLLTAIESYSTKKDISNYFTQLKFFSMYSKCIFIV